MTTYVKNYPGGWQPGVGGGTPIAHDKLDNMETQYDCAKGDLDDTINTATGHDHDGVNSKPVSFDDLVDKPDADDLVSGTPEWGDVYYRGTSASARLGHGLTGQAFFTAGHGADPYWSYFDGEIYCGDGSDGDVTVSVDTTLARDTFYDNLTVNNGITLNTAGYRIYVRGTLANNGTIQNNGGNGGSGVTGGAGGAGATQNNLGGGAAGGIGNEGVGTSIGYSLGGSGGAGGGFAGGAGGTATPPTAVQFNTKIYAYMALMRTTSTVNVLVFGGAGGGGGRCDEGAGGGTGGGGGGGGGTVWIAAGTLVNNGTIRANGGAGGIGEDQALNPGGGGGGGGGGVVVLIYFAKTAAGTIQAQGGSGGAGGSPGGTAGSVGSAGNVYEIVIK